MRIEDISPNSAGGASIYLRRSKTDQEGTGRWIRVGDRTWLAVQDWLKQAKIQEGFLLRGVRNNGMVNECMYDGQVARIFKQLAKSAGLDDKVVKQISGHSLRVGGAQDLLKSGASLPQIMAAGGWTKTETVMRYVERAL
jgi:integrase